jgi:histidinol-phosphatase (PHP family)
MKCDYHIHTSYSDDSTFEMEEVVKLAIKIHLDEICFTDHVDYGVKRDWDDPKGILYKNDTVFMNVDYPSYMAQIAYLKEKYKDQIIIKAGMEFGACY